MKKRQNTVDFALLLLLWLSFASLSTHHVALAFRIGERLGTIQGWLALLAFPLAPYFGWRAGFKVSSLVWGALLINYGVFLFVASR